MKLPLDIPPIARIAFFDAVAWYEKQQPGLGRRFYLAVDSLLSDIAADPRCWAKIRKTVRQAIVTGWPYYVCYRITRTSIRVIAIYHAARDPAGWQGRT